MTELNTSIVAPDAVEPRWMRLAPSANPRSIGVLRIAAGLAGLYLGLSLVSSQAHLLPRVLWHPPVGTQWAVDVIPLSPGLYRTAGWGLVLASVAVILGYRGRVAASVGVLLGLYAGWVPHLTGKVDHYHHVIWFLALVALSPCDDALAVRPSGVRRRPEVYAAVSLSGALMLGVIYLSSAIPKLTVGWDWVVSDNMRNIMWWQWYEKQHSVPVPIDQWSIVYKGMGLVTLVFETLFSLGVLFRGSRRVFAVVGLLLHLGIWLVLGIGFWTLMIFYVVLFDWGVGEERVPSEQVSASQWGMMSPIILALVIALGGLTGESNGWPLAGYPLFGGIAQPEYREFSLIGDDEETYVTRSALADRYGPHHVRVMVAVAVIRGHEREFLRHASTLEDGDPALYDAIDSVVISTNPDSLGDVLRRERLTDR